MSAETAKVARISYIGMHLLSESTTHADSTGACGASYRQQRVWAGQPWLLFVLRSSRIVGVPDVWGAWR